MAQPPSYIRNKDFTEDFGNETDHSALNAELDRASNSINDIRFNLAILQADDGRLRPSVVTPDSISPELRVSLVEGVILDAQAMLDRSLAAANASSAAAEEAKASETASKASATDALVSANNAAESARVIALAINSDWNASDGAAAILNKPELSEVAQSGLYDDLTGKPENLATVNDIALLSTQKFDKSGGTVSGRISLKDANVWIDRDEYGQIVMSSSGSTFALSTDGSLFTNGKLLRCVTDAFNDGTNWYRKWSDGWIEQGGAIGSLPEGEITITFPLPFAQADYHFNASQVGAFDATSFYIRWIENYRKTPTSIAVWGGAKMWYACGQGA